MASLLVLFLMSASAIYIRMREGSWLSLGALTMFIWTVLCAFGANVGIRDSTYAPGIMYILLACWLVHFGFMFGNGLTKKRSSERKNIALLQSDLQLVLARTLVLSSILSVVTLLLLVFGSGFGVGNLITLDGMMEMSAANRNLYGYNKEADQTSIQKVLLVVVFFAAMLSGLAFRIARRRWVKSVALIPLWSSVMYGIAFGSRMGALYAGSFWIGSYVAASLLIKKAVAFDMRSETYRVVSWSGVMFIVIPVFTMLVRYQDFRGNLSFSRIQDLYHDQFQFVGAFAVWFEREGVTYDEPMYGYRTFTRLYEQFGISFGEQEAINVGEGNSNIFTAFRGIIEDFTIYGSFLAIWSAAVLSGLLFRKVVSGNFVYVPALSLFYAQLFCSPAFSVFTYTSPTLGSLTFMAFIWLVMTRTRRRGTLNETQSWQSLDGGSVAKSPQFRTLTK